MRKAPPRFAKVEVEAKQNDGRSLSLNLTLVCFRAALLSVLRIHELSLREQGDFYE
jgi:hypothetical protein